MARVMLTPAAARQLAELPLVVRARVARILERLADWPHVSGAKPLRGHMARRWRMRTGDWRVQFVVLGDEVRVEHVGHRDGFYER